MNYKQVEKLTKLARIAVIVSFTLATLGLGIVSFIQYIYSITIGDGGWWAYMLISSPLILLWGHHYYVYN